MMNWLKKNWLLVGLGVGAYLALKRKAAATPTGTPPYAPLPVSANPNDPAYFCRTVQGASFSANACVPMVPSISRQELQQTWELAVAQIRAEGQDPNTESGFLAAEHLWYQLFEAKGLTPGIGPSQITSVQGFRGFRGGLIAPDLSDRYSYWPPTGWST